MGWFHDAVSSVTGAVSGATHAVQEQATVSALRDQFQKVQAAVKSKATLKTASYVAPLPLLASASGREKLQETYKPLIAPAANIIAPGSGTLVSGLAGNAAGSGASSFDFSGLLSGLFSPAPAAPVALDRPQPPATTDVGAFGGGGVSYAPGDGGGGGPSWLLIAGAAGAAILVVVLVSRR